MGFVVGLIQGQAPIKVKFYRTRATHRKMDELIVRIIHNI